MASSGDHTASKADAEEVSADEYFTSYADMSVQELMLKDKSRTLAYKTFIEKNPDLFRDKIVIDVGAGTGILSLFAARAGAKQVYAVEASSLSVVCQQIVACNGLTDKITVVHGKVEDVSLPAGLQADVLLSEWMGFYLLHESMLNSVITARDKWLSPDGVMVPSSATLYLCPVSMKDYYKENVVFWRDVYGFDYEPFQSLVLQKLQSQPVITTVKADQCLAPAEQMMRLDLKYVDAEDILKIPGRFQFEMQKHGVMHGFVCWFDVEFEGEVDVTLSTGPEAPETHWQQTVMFLPSALMVSKSETLACTMLLTKDATTPRRYNICIEVVEETDDEGEGEADSAPDKDITMETKDLIQKAIDSHTASQ